VLLVLLDLQVLLDQTVLPAQLGQLAVTVLQVRLVFKESWVLQVPLVLVQQVPLVLQVTKANQVLLVLLDKVQLEQPGLLEQQVLQVLLDYKAVQVLQVH
jgi:hypothetical protein